MQIGVGISLTSGGGAWSPARLGSSLLGWWDAERADKITLSGSAVTTWTDIQGGLAPTQGTAGFKPAYSATGFNSSRPAITPDGTDDYLNIDSQPFPSICEVWALVDQQALSTDATARALISFGGTLSASRITIQRPLGNLLQGVVGNGSVGVSVSHPGDFSGKCVTRLIVNGATAALELNGVAATPVAVVAAIGNTRIRLFAANSTSPANFWGSPVNTIVVTGLLSAGQAAQMYSYLNARKG